MTIHILTKNPGKILVAKSIFDTCGIEIIFVDKEYPEIQADTSLEIAKFTALQAVKDLNIPIIREDHSLFINALGIPGPYTSYIEKKLPVEKLLKLMRGQSDRTGYFEVATVYAEPSGCIKEFIFQVPIVIANEEKGNLHSGWNKIIQLQGENRTLAEYPEEERINIWNKNYRKIADWLISKKE